MIKKERGIEHTNLLIYLERYTAFLFEMVYCTQQLTRKYKQHTLSLGRMIWWVKALHSELEEFHFKPTWYLPRVWTPTSLLGSQLPLDRQSMKCIEKVLFWVCDMHVHDFSIPVHNLSFWDVNICKTCWGRVQKLSKASFHV